MNHSLKEIPMRKTKLIAAALFGSLLIPVASHADALDPKTVPADAKWVVHADLDAARDTKTFDTIRDRFLAADGAQTKLDQIEMMTGLKIPDELNDVTLYGREAGDMAGVILVHGKIDRNRTVKSLHMAQQFSSTSYGTYEVLTWLDTDKNQTMYGAFHDESHVIIGRTEKNIDAALDTMDGKAESIKSDSPLAAGAKPQLLMYVAAKDMPQLHGAADKPNPIVGSVDSGWISLSEKDDMVTLAADLTATSPDTAADLQQSLMGLKAMLGLAAGGDTPNPVAKAVVAADKTFKTTLKEKTVSVSWPMPVEQAATIFSAIADQQPKK
jgi:hypothetical protein